MLFLCYNLLQNSFYLLRIIYPPNDMRHTIENAAEADEIFSMLMGDDVEPRRQFIEKNATYANINA